MAWEPSQGIFRIEIQFQHARASETGDLELSDSGGGISPGKAADWASRSLG